jgi:hypothetical protein
MSDGEAERQELSSRISSFWAWFRTAVAFGGEVNDPKLLRELDDQVSILNPNLSWELGPGFSEPWRFVISPNLDRELRELATEVIAHAPVLSNWEFYSSRQPKRWDYRIVLLPDNGDPIELDASNWTFVLLRYPDGSHELLLKGRDLPALTESERWQAAAIVLESVLGEELTMQRIDHFELLEELEPKFAPKERPIQELRDAIRGCS